MACLEDSQHFSVKCQLLRRKFVQDTLEMHRVIGHITQRRTKTGSSRYVLAHSQPWSFHAANAWALTALTALMFIACADEVRPKEGRGSRQIPSRMVSKAGAERFSESWLIKPAICRMSHGFPPHCFFHHVSYFVSQKGVDADMQ